MATPYEPPSIRARAFNCPHCGAFAHQTFYDLGPMRAWHSNPNEPVDRDVERLVSNECLAASICFYCVRPALWRNEELLYPVTVSAPRPAQDMPDDIRVDFEEARQVLNTSPRSACALLRLALQKLMVHLVLQREFVASDLRRMW
jgi:hypothetical protein